ncbi:hypothetical protein OIU80_20300, partial [Flavobacterium sp. LS1R47]
MKKNTYKKHNYFKIILFVFLFLITFQIRAEYPFSERFKNSTVTGIFFNGTPKDFLTGRAGYNAADGLGYLRLTSNHKYQREVSGLDSYIFPSVSSQTGLKFINNDCFPNQVLNFIVDPIPDSIVTSVNICKGETGSLTVTPTLYVNKVMPAITHTTINAVGIKDSGVSGANGLPKGVSAVWEEDKITIVGTPIVSGVFNYKIPLIGDCGDIYAEGRIVVNSSLDITLIPVSICKGDSKSLSGSITARSVTTFMGLWNTDAGPRAFVPFATKDDMYTCKFSDRGKNVYTATKFTVSVSGVYKFIMEDRSDYNGSAYIYTGDFTPGYCDRGGQWIVGVSNPDRTLNEPEFSANLDPGVEYTLISVLTPYVGDTNMWDYKWTVEPPRGGKFLLDPLIYWYKSKTGGDPIGSGSPFNPVGAKGSGLVNTNTPGTTTYYASDVSDRDSPRVPVDFVIKEDPIAGVPSIKPTLYINKVMPAITHTTINAVGIKDSGVSGANGLPKGVSAVCEEDKITIVGTPIVSGVFNYKIPLIGGCGDIYAEGTIIVNYRRKIDVVPVSMCKGGSDLLSASTTARSVTTFMGLWNLDTDPRAFVPSATKDDMYTCKFYNRGRNPYTATKFTVSVSGVYKFIMEDRSNYSGSAYIFTGDFTPGYCDRGGQWIVGVSNPDQTLNEPEFSANLDPGVEYTLISVLTPHDGETNVWDYKWTVEPPTGGEFLLDPLIYWYKSETGGEHIGSGPSFNPVGVKGSGLVNTNTPGTTTYYVSDGDSPRTPVDFVIKEDVVAGVASSRPILCGNDKLTDITHTTIDAVGIKNDGDNGANGLPDGVQATWEANTITISGNPRELGVYNYKIPLIGGCGNVFAEGRITISEVSGKLQNQVNVSCKGEATG